MYLHMASVLLLNESLNIHIDECDRNSSELFCMRMSTTGQLELRCYLTFERLGCSWPLVYLQAL